MLFSDGSISFRPLLAHGGKAGVSFVQLEWMRARARNRPDANSIAADWPRPSLSKRNLNFRPSGWLLKLPQWPASSTLQ